MRKYYFLLVALFFCWGCGGNHIPFASGVSIDTIHFTSLKEISQLPDSVIRNKQYINISMEDEELLFGRIDQIEVTDGRIYISDSRIKILAVFDSAGRGIGKIGAIGRAPAEYMDIASFTVGLDGNIYLVDGRLDKINVYDKNLKFISSKKLPYEVDVLYSLSPDSFLAGLSSWDNTNSLKPKLVCADSNFRIQEIYCQYDNYVDDNTWLSSYYLVHTDHGIFYNRPLDNMVRQFSFSGQPVKGYYFDFGNKEIPLHAKKDYEKYKELYEDTYTLIDFTVVSDNYILGRIRDNEKHKNFLINRPANSVYMDEHTSFSTLGKVVGCTGNKIITCLLPGEYTDLKEELILPEDVKKHLENQGFTLCLYELK